ncbi:MAG: adenylosuccinate synthase [Spirochaetales bacterium]|jgi:adenylosuccinate synthase|nr:adenylosuccinate synthase [Spirochaetales bacterium]
MNLVVIGAQWGDEGKGKIVDFLAQDSDLVVRFSGGANAGHTIVVGEETYKLHLIPSGIVYPDKKVLLGAGMVVDVQSLFAELEELSRQGLAWQGRVFLSDRAHLVLPDYKDEDRELEGRRFNPIGTTGRGIGVTFAHKAHRNGIRVVDLFDSELWARMPESYRSFLEDYRERLNGMRVNQAAFMADFRNKKILLEGSQGVLLDLDWGTYPFVSSGYSTAAGACQGGGLGPGRIDRVLGVFKAYSTRVGNGPFPSEFTEGRDGDLGNRIRELGREYGVTTGRPRRTGYLDLTALRYACRVSGIDSLVLTHIDVYDGFDEIKVCTAYRFRGEELTDFPSSTEVLEKAEPVLKGFPGWKTRLASSRTYEELPPQARSYIQFIEDYCETPVDVISVGYRRKETFIRRPLWTRS